MHKQTNAERDPEAILLARVYALILSWGEPEPTRADAANAPKTREPQTKKDAGGKRND